jgi:hypothetical protein
VTLVWLHALPALSTTSSLSVDSENASNVKLEKKLSQLEPPAKMIAELSPVQKITVNMEASAFKSITGPNVTAQLDSLGSFARLMSTNAPPGLATMGELAWICLKATDVTVRMDIPVSSVKMNSPTALRNPVPSKQCAWISRALTTISVFADLVTKETIAISQQILALRMATLATMELSAELFLRVDTPANVKKDGREGTVMTTLTTALNSPVYLAETAQILKMTSVASVQ